MIVFVPIPSSLGRVVSTLSSPIFSTTLKKSSVTAGSFSVKELSVNVKFQLTDDVFFPASLFTVVSFGQVNVGG